MTTSTVVDFNITCPCGAHFGEIHFQDDQPHVCICSKYHITSQGAVEPVAPKPVNAFESRPELLTSGSVRSFP